MLFKARSSLLFLQTVEHSLQLTWYQGCIIITINESLLFSRQPIKWQNLPVPSRVTSWDRGPSREGSQVALGTRLQTSQMGQNGGLANKLDAKVRDAINQHLPEVLSAVISMVNNQRPSAPRDVQPQELKDNERLNKPGNYSNVVSS